MKLSDISDRDLGVWVWGATRNSIVVQNLEIIKGAINTWGWDAYSIKDWTLMFKTHIDHEPQPPTEEDAIELSWVLDDAVEWMNNQLPAGYYFTFEDTNFILTHEDFEENK
jgi:hypothetical protein